MRLSFQELLSWAACLEPGTGLSSDSIAQWLHGQFLFWKTFEQWLHGLSWNVWKGGLGVCAIPVAWPSSVFYCKWQYLVHGILENIMKYSHFVQTKPLCMKNPKYHQEKQGFSSKNNRKPNKHIKRNSIRCFATEHLWKSYKSMKEHKHPRNQWKSMTTLKNHENP